MEDTVSHGFSLLCTWVWLLPYWCPCRVLGMGVWSPRQNTEFSQSPVPYHGVWACVVAASSMVTVTEQYGYCHRTVWLLSQNMCDSFALFRSLLYSCPHLLCFSCSVLPKDTAFCKNVFNDEWYSYDDSTVKKVSSNQVHVSPWGRCTWVSLACFTACVLNALCV